MGPTKSQTLVASRVKVDDGFINEALITGVKKMAKVFPELAENQIDDGCLILGGELLIEGEFLYDEIVVVFESLFNSLSYVQVQRSWQKQFDSCGICLLQFFYPEI